jgi:hypothetical protein
MKKVFYGAAIMGAVDKKDRSRIHQFIIEAIKISVATSSASIQRAATSIKCAWLLEDSLISLPHVEEERPIVIRRKMVEFIEGHIDAVIFKVSTPMN